MITKSSKIKSILVIDSGIGGLSILAKALTQTKTNYIYFADNKHSPYGEKSNLFLQNRLSGIISQVSRKYNISMVVLACNTATTSSIEFLRKSYPKSAIVGTEPAYKVAIEQNFKKPAIIATPRTIENISTKVNNNFKLLPNKNLASIVENNFDKPSPIHTFYLLKEILKIKKSVKSCDCLVLGCTHYSFIKEKLSKFINIPIIDGNQGVSNQIFKIIQPKTNKNNSVKIILSNQNSNSLQKYKKILRQILANQIKLW